ncbi:ATPase involved in DNA repair,IncA protein [Chlamydia serpentis]|uniref:ATPase involved in DNA repair,IncA protein n=1 Tax=Chlamydia serpentis TaxID=1967782 RepID=A0A2R8FCN7_9CHLA|nr:hypothetical protein [Chlamydia serpentis]SPN74131.1 ATPase involved in DNA repair,IncA protein [Chlamydia serpentis]
MSSVSLSSLSVNDDQKNSLPSQRVVIKPPSLFVKVAIPVLALTTLLGAALLVGAALGIFPSLIFSIIGLLSLVAGLLGLMIFTLWFVSFKLQRSDQIDNFLTKQDQDQLRIRELQIENNELEQKCACLVQENEKLQYSNYQQQFGSESKYIAILETRNSELKSQLDELTKTYENQASKLLDLQDKNTRLQAMYEDLSNQNLELQKQLIMFKSENLLFQDEHRELSKQLQIYKQQFSLASLEAWKEDVQCIINQNSFLKAAYKNEISNLPLEQQRLFLYPKGFRLLVDRMAPQSRFFQIPKYEYNCRNGDLQERRAAMHNRLVKEFLTSMLGACTYEEIEQICVRAEELSKTASPDKQQNYNLLRSEFPSLLVAESLWVEWCDYVYPYLRPFLSLDYCKHLFLELFHQLHQDLIVSGSSEDKALVRLFCHYNGHIPLVLASFSLPPSAGSVFAFTLRQELLLWSDLEFMARTYLRNTFTVTQEWTGSIESVLSYHERCTATADMSRQAALAILHRGLQEEEEAVISDEPETLDSSWTWKEPPS